MLMREVAHALSGLRAAAAARPAAGATGAAAGQSSGRLPPAEPRGSLRDFAAAVRRLRVRRARGASARARRRRRGSVLMCPRAVRVEVEERRERQPDDVLVVTVDRAHERGAGRPGWRSRRTARATRRWRCTSRASAVEGPEARRRCARRRRAPRAVEQHDQPADDGVGAPAERRERRPGRRRRRRACHRRARRARRPCRSRGPRAAPRAVDRSGLAAVRSRARAARARPARAPPRPARGPRTSSPRRARIARRCGEAEARTSGRRALRLELLEEQRRLAGGGLGRVGAVDHVRRRPPARSRRGSCRARPPAGRWPRSPGGGADGVGALEHHRQDRARR